MNTYNVNTPIVPFYLCLRCQEWVEPYLSIISGLININDLEPKATPLGSCIGTWNELLGKRRKK